MTIELKSKEKNKIYGSRLITGYLFRCALQLKERQEEQELNADLLDEIGQFVCEVFDNKFTLTDLYEGLQPCEMVGVFNNVLLKVLDTTTYYQKK